MQLEVRACSPESFARRMRNYELVILEYSPTWENLRAEPLPLHVVPSSVNSLYTPLGLPVIGEQKRLSTYWSARTITSARRTIASACRTTASACRTIASACRSSPSAHRSYAVEKCIERRMRENYTITNGQKFSGLITVKDVSGYAAEKVNGMEGCFFTFHLNSYALVMPSSISMRSISFWSWVRQK